MATIAAGSPPDVSGRPCGFRDKRRVRVRAGVIATSLGQKADAVAHGEGEGGVGLKQYAAVHDRDRDVPVRPAHRAERPSKAGECSSSRISANWKPLG
jgi:hypothetical protein